MALFALAKKNTGFPKTMPIRVMFVAEYPSARGKGFFSDEDSNNLFLEQMRLSIKPVQYLSFWCNKAY